MGEFNPINSQDELDAIIKNRIERERKTTAEKEVIPPKEEKKDAHPKRKRITIKRT